MFNSIMSISPRKQRKHGYTEEQFQKRMEQQRIRRAAKKKRKEEEKEEKDIALMHELIAKYQPEGILPPKDDQLETICFCRRPSTAQSAFCSNANCHTKEFHHQCVGLQEDFDTLAEKWYCPACEQLLAFQTEAVEQGMIPEAGECRRLTHFITQMDEADAYNLSLRSTGRIFGCRVATSCFGKIFAPRSPAMGIATPHDSGHQTVV